MNKPKEIRACFKPITYSLQVNVSPPNTGTIIKSPKKSGYAFGEQVILTAVGNPGYIFQNWDGALNGGPNPITITITGDTTVGAVFVVDNTPRSPQGDQAANLPLVGKLESPSDSKAVSGVKPIYGWALDREEISKVELLIDGTYVCDIPYGGLREDLKEAYAAYPNAEKGGFALIWNYAVLTPGEHAVQVKAHNARGETLDLNSMVTVVKFHGEVVDAVQPEVMSPNEVTVTSDGVTRTYDIYLRWFEEIQDFGITEIVPKE